jgi:hypothetical protein
MRSMRSPSNIFLITFVGLGVVAILMAQSHSVRYPEYQIRMVTTMAVMSPQTSDHRPMTIERVHAGKKDGSKASRTTEIINLRPCTTTTSWDVTSHLQVTSSDCVKMKSTVPFSTPPGDLARPPVPTCKAMMDVTEPAPTVENIQGLSVERFEYDNPTERQTLYLAPSLGCMTVRALHFWKGPGGAIVSTTFEEPVEIKLGSHDPEIFSVPPSDYREVPPSERRNALGTYFSGQPRAAACLQPGNDRQDKKYLEARRQQARSTGLLAMLRSRLKF